MVATDVRQVRLDWAGEGLVFRGGPDGGPEVVVDGDSQQGLAPMQLLLASLAGCMAIDVRMILEKSRVPLEALEMEAIGTRASEVPKRFLAIELVYRLRGPEPEHQEKVERAIELSRVKYCSVLHTLDPGIELGVRVELA